MNTFKYQSDYDSLKEGCPPDYYSSSNIDEAFRWVFDKIDNSENFRSAYHKNPPRFLDKNDKEKCKSLGLSFFDNENGAIKRFEEIRNSIGNKISKTIGSNLAKGSILSSDGVSGDVESDKGHFTHHPYEPEIIQQRFIIIKPLI